MRLHTAAVVGSIITLALLVPLLSLLGQPSKTEPNQPAAPQEQEPTPPPEAPEIDNTPPDDEGSIRINPLAGKTLYTDPNSAAREQIRAWSTTQPMQAELLEQIASQPTARWFGNWNSDVAASVRSYVASARASSALPVLVAYNIPNRDCGGYSSGGAATAAAYRTWVTAFANGIGASPAVVILEPDALAASCADDARIALLNDAIDILNAQENTFVYIDAGHSAWRDAATMADRLSRAGIAEADGFALNVSNFFTTTTNIHYGTEISRLIDNAHFVIDTSRNGNGANGEWCNPPGRKIGTAPTTRTGYALVDAFLWVKPPGESDGTCNGGPAAGTWWAEYALQLVN